MRKFSVAQMEERSTVVVKIYAFEQKSGGHWFDSGSRDIRL